jgi:IS1 family transposase/transposase-like protein
MHIVNLIEHVTLVTLAFTLGYVLWQQRRKQLKKLWEAARKAARKRRKWKPKTPKDCPACESGVSLAVRPIRRDVQPWRERKSTRGRRKQSRTQGHACLNPDCDYFSVTDARVHALVSNGKRGKYKHIQTFKCQACQVGFSSRRNTPLYHLKTHPGRVEMCLWLLAEGVDISVLVRFSGHVDATLTRWLARAGVHSENLHTVLFVHLELAYLQVDELHAPVAGNKRRSWLWVAIEPVTKIIPAVHLGTRGKEDAYHFVHDLKLRLAEDCVPAFTSDGLRAYFYAITAHFGEWVAGKDWVVSNLLAYGQLIKRKNKKKDDGKPFTITRMMWGKRWQLFQTLLELGFSATIQTAFIERVNLTIRQGIAPLARKTWSLAKSQESLLLHVHWWRGFYHFARPHQSLRERVPGLKRRYQERTPAMAAGFTDHVWKVGDLLSLPLVFEGGTC